MPDLSLEEALKEAYASAPSAEVILHTLEFRHYSFTTPIRVVRDNHDLTAYLEAGAVPDGGSQVTFVAMAYEMTQPDVERSSSPEIEIKLDNVSGEIIGYLDLAAQSPELIEVVYRPYLISDLSGPQMSPPLSLVVRSVSADIFQVTARCGYGDMANRKFPGEVYTSERFPGMRA